MITEFYLGGVKWDVVIDNERLDDLKLLGLCEMPKSRISVYDKGINTDLVNQTLYHEVIHAILESMSEHTLSQNEEFVQKFALLLHQFETSKKSKSCN